MIYNILSKYLLYFNKYIKFFYLPPSVKSPLILSPAEFYRFHSIASLIFNLFSERSFLNLGFEKESGFFTLERLWPLWNKFEKSYFCKFTSVGRLVRSGLFLAHKILQKYINKYTKKGNLPRVGFEWLGK